MTNQRISKEIDRLFQDAPKTRRASELKEEMIANLAEKYNDLVQRGKTEEEAYNQVMSGIGDIDELLKNLSSDYNLDYERLEQERKKSALRVTAAIAGYFLAFLMLIVFGSFLKMDDLGFVVMLIIAGISTCLLIYNAMVKPKYVKADATMVEEFKEWKSGNDRSKSIRNSINGILWMIIVCLYFIISFGTGAWYISWIIFIIGGVVSAIVDLLFKIMNDK